MYITTILCDLLQRNRSVGNKPEFVEKIRKALYASKIVSYAQGFMLLREAADNYGWKLNYGGIGNYKTLKSARWRSVPKTV